MESEKYRSFKTSEECFNEMKKHEPFGWLYDPNFKDYSMCLNILEAGICFNKMYCTFYVAFTDYVFADKTPFGIKDYK